jgi:metallo-beta-lactamase family protein
MFAQAPEAIQSSEYHYAREERAMRIGFHGAARTVTGSKYLLTYGDYRLLVDCGLFQGDFGLHQRNWKPMAFRAAEVSDVLFTHAHIDHTGYFPRLVKDGFSGRGLASPPTKALLGILLPDSGGLQEEEARWVNKIGSSRHAPALPLYTESDARDSLRLLARIEFGERVMLHPGLQVTLHRAGHILGAAFLEIAYKNRSGEHQTIVFSGDMGRRGIPILHDPEPLPEADYVVMESTYGDRIHEKRDVQGQIKAALEAAFARGGVVVIPAFAVGRTQELLYRLHELFEANQLPRVPVWVDSPMANSVVDLYSRFRAEHDPEMLELENHGHSPLVSPYFRVCRAREDSKLLNQEKGPAVIISASGMATGGRVLHHLLHRLGKRENTILFVGYQAEGTLGRRLLEGETEVKILGEMVRVEAAIELLPTLSAHADSLELMDWLRNAPRPPKAVFLTHGEPAAQEALAAQIRGELGWTVRIPAPDEIVEV